MTQRESLGVIGFWIGVVLLYGLLFLLHNHFYVMSDAIATSAGAVIGPYLAGWGLWYVANRIWPRRIPGRLYSITILAYLFAFANAWTLINRLLA